LCHAKLKVPKLTPLLSMLPLLLPPLLLLILQSPFVALAADALLRRLLLLLADPLPCSTCRLSSWKGLLLGS
jgi:hypothetical protein